MAEKMDTLDAIFSSNRDWMARAFAVPDTTVSQVQHAEDYKARYFSNSDLLFGDTSLGGGPALNMPPAFTEDADLPTGFGFDGKLGSGYGIRYGEVIYPNLELINIRVGTRKFNTLANFFLYMYDDDQGKLAMNGETSAFYKVLGTITNAIFMIPRIPFMVYNRFMSWLTDKPLAAYYYMRPQQALFWGRFSAAMEDFAVKAGMAPGILADHYNEQGVAVPKKLTIEDAEAFNKILPDLFKENGGFDIFGISLRYSRLQEAWRTLQTELATRGYNFWDYSRAVATTFGNLPGKPAQGATSVLHASREAEVTVEQLLAVYNKSTFGTGTFEEPVNSSSATTTNGTPAAPAEELSINDYLETGKLGKDSTTVFEISEGTRYDRGIWDYMTTSQKGGSQWLTLAVEPIMSVDFSLSSSYGQSAIAESINAKVAAARSAKVSTMGGATGIPGVDQVIGGLKSAAEFLTPNAILGTLAGANVSIPDVFQSASSTMPNPSYKITTHCVSVHPYSKLMMIAPHVALICLAACQSTGAATFAEPFLLELRHQSKNQISLGGLRQLSISHGGEIGDWDLFNMPNIMTSTFEFENLDKSWHYPTLKQQLTSRQEVSSSSDYFTLLSGMTLHDYYAIGESFNRATARLRSMTDRFTSSNYWGYRATAVIDSTFLHYFAFTPDKR